MGTKRADAYRLHVKIHLQRASLAKTGKALGVLFRRHLSPRQIGCTTERTNSTKVSRKAEVVIQKLLGRPSPWGSPAFTKQPETRTVLLDDEKVHQLAERWGSGGIGESAVVVPHIFYLPLLRCSIRNLELQAPEILRQICIFFDYPVLDPMPDILRPCLLGERDEVLEYAEKKRLPYIDSGHQLFLENVISLACYMVPAKYLVFKDDDFFVKDGTSLEKLLGALRRGYHLSGMYTGGMERIHTCLFGLRPEYLRDELLLFDDGENLYSHESLDTGTLLYRALSKREKGVCVLGEYPGDDGPLGRHLCHCGAELWYDLPQALKVHFRVEMIPKSTGRLKLDVGILLEALAFLFKVPGLDADYDPVGNELRRKSHDRDFAPYLAKVYNNHRWLERHAGSG